MGRKEANPGQRYACDRPGCDKHYSRPDHLLRHKLNHDRERVLACNQCDRTFVRQDLLARHLERHAVRGKTLGRWSGKRQGGGEAGSKRSRIGTDGGDDDDEDDEEEEDEEEDENDEEGAHDRYQHQHQQEQQQPSQRRAQRPNGEQYPSPSAGPSMGYQRAYPSDVYGSSDAQYQARGLDGRTASPSTSITSPFAELHPAHYPAPYPARTPPSSYSRHNGDGPIRPPLPYQIFEQEEQQQHHQQQHQQQQQQQQQSRHQHQHHHQHQEQLTPQQLAYFPPGQEPPPDHSSWLPPEQYSSPSFPTTHQQHPPPPPPPPALTTTATGSTSTPAASNVFTQLSADPYQAPAHASRVSAGPFAPADSHVTWREGTSINNHGSNGSMLLPSQQQATGPEAFPFSLPDASDVAADYDWLFDGVDPSLSVRAEDMASELSGVRSNFTKDGEDPIKGVPTSLETGSDDWPPQEHAGHHDGLTGIDETLAGFDGRDSAGTEALQDLAFFASLQSEIPNEAAFDVDAEARDRLLFFLSSLPELPTSPLFTPSALRCYIHLFFTKLNTIYPLIHRPTFSARMADPMLLSAIIVCGAHFADDAAHLLAERIGRKLWGAYVSFDDFRPARATLSMLQAMLITEIFGKLMGTRPQHETAHLFHNFIITLARRNAVFSPSKVKLPSDPEEKWRAWSKEEEKKRIAFFAFILDAQHATMFRHIPALSSFQIHLQLPCDEDEWSAKTARDWVHLRRQRGKDPSYFIAALKASLNPDHTPPMSDKDSFPQFILLHGLMSVAYDLQWKQQTLLAAPETSESISSWKDKIKASYSAWKLRLDAACYNTSSATARAIFRASHSLVVWAQVVLHADSVDIQIYAGLPTVLGRFIDHHTFSVSRRACKEWARSADGRIAAWFAASFLKATILVDAEDRSATTSTGFDELLHHHWVQYLCALTLWAYGKALAPPRAKLDLPNQARSRSQESGSDGVPSSLSNLLQITPGRLAQRRLSVPSFERTRAEATAFLNQVTTQRPENGSPTEHPYHLTASVLELVDREVRGSRWELEREASGVLRKLIRADQQLGGVITAVPTPAGTPPPLGTRLDNGQRIKIEGA